MRIVKISIHNLNSLIGKWEIDLDHPDIRNNGIFAICGPTGAGKTTILDAMSLALYGRTPRLESITQSENEVMSQSCGECASEVIFEANGQKFKAHWSQQRARKKFDGKLQQARPELSVFNPANGDWEILATQKTAFDKEIARVTGLTYEEFTRSILLAQGSFAAFLKAKSEVRSAALEKITGTQLYSEISKLVHQRYAKEEAVVNESKAKLEGIEILDDDLRQALKQQLKEQQELQTRLLSQEKNLHQARDWRKDVVTTTLELERLTQSLADAKARYQQALAKKPALDKARLAESIVSDFDARVNAQKTLQTQQTALQKLVGELPAFQAKSEKAQKNLTQADTDCNKSQTAWAALEKTLVEVRKLDTDISHASADLNRENKALSTVEKSLSDKNKELSQVRLNEEKTRQTVTALQALENPEHPEQKLAGDISNLEVLYDSVQTAAKTYGQRKKSFTTAQKRLNEAQKKFDELAPKVQEVKNAYALAQARVKSADDEFEQIRDGKTAAQWREILQAAKDKLLHLKELSQTLKKLSVLDHSIAETSKAMEANRAQHAASSALNESHEKLLATLESSLNRFEEQQKLLSLIEQLQTARKDLKEGHPCPLCGALEHPWAEQLPEQKLDQSEGKQIKADIKTTQDKINAAVKSLSELDGIFQSLQKTLARDQKECKELQDTRLEILQTLDLTQDADTETLNQWVVTLKAEGKAADGILKKLDKLQDDRKELLEARDKAQNEQQATLANVTSARENLAGANATYENEEKLLKDSAESLKTIHDAVKEKLSEHGFDMPKALSELTELMTSVKERVQKLHANLKTLAQARTQVAQLKTKLDGLNENITGLSQDVRERKASIQKADQDLLELRKKRSEIFSDKDCDTEEKLAKDTLSGYLTQRDSAQAALQKAANDLSALNGQIQAKEGSIQALRQEAQIKDETWTKMRTQAGFESDNVWSAARMPQEALAAGERDIESGKAQTQAIEKSLKDKQSHLSELNAKPLTEASLENLQAQIAELSQNRSQCDQTVGQMQEKLRQDNETRKRRSSLLETLELQKKTLAVWAKLHALIGSADGKKYRQFVQSITFDTLLAYSNEALRMMSDRYRLKRDESDFKEPLGINVIDNYQGGIERSSKNLSGGETFIVSLALSLGLSKMAGRNVRVESLFLDEGFGTLDADALDAALSTLASLNSQGKLIGIISHVGEIRERIGAIIEVKPETGGVSRLSGPGARSLSER